MARPQAYATKAKISRALYQNLRLLGTNSRPDAESGSYQLTGRWLWAAVAFREGAAQATLFAQVALLTQAAQATLSTPSTSS